MRSLRWPGATWSGWPRATTKPFEGLRKQRAHTPYQWPTKVLQWICINTWYYDTWLHIFYTYRYTNIVTTITIYSIKIIALTYILTHINIYTTIHNTYLYIYVCTVYIYIWHKPSDAPYLRICRTDWLPKSRAKLGKGLDIQEASPADKLDVGCWMGKCMKHLYMLFLHVKQQWNQSYIGKKNNRIMNVFFFNYLPAWTESNIKGFPYWTLIRSWWLVNKHESDEASVSKLLTHLWTYDHWRYIPYHITSWYQILRRIMEQQKVITSKCSWIKCLAHLSSNTGWRRDGLQSNHVALKVAKSTITLQEQ